MIAATFHGPNHFVPNYDESTIEVFENIGHAIAVLFDRYDSKGEHPLPVRYLDGKQMEVPFRFVEEGDYFECYKVTEYDGPVPSTVWLGEAAITEALTNVHIGVWDYKLLLMRPFGTGNPSGNISVSVMKH
jgi:hypothetical protein